MSRISRLSMLALTLAAVLAASTPLQAAEAPSGLRGLEGESLGDADLAEGVTLLVFWASWSPRCRDIGERVGRISERWEDRAEVATVNFQESAQAARDFARRQKLAVPVYLDPEAVFAKRHAVTALPFLLIFRDGEIVFSGKLIGDAEAAIGRALE